jgi:acyl-CoA synthetase (AMP-forming)/AMP-acid ligase II
MSFAALSHYCGQVATLLMGQGLQPGDTVSLVMPNGLNTLRLLLGAMHGGWCVNPVNLLSSPEQMRYVLEHSDCKLVLASPDWAERVQAVLSNLSRPVALLVCSPDMDPQDRLLESLQPTSMPEPQAQAMALLMYTSGTTGVPKGVVLTQSNLAANAMAISAEHRLGARDRVLAVLPLYHINAFAVTMLAPLAHGGSLAMPPKFSAARFWQQALHTAAKAFMESEKFEVTEMTKAKWKGKGGLTFLQCLRKDGSPPIFRTWEVAMMNDGKVITSIEARTALLYP